MKRRRKKIGSVDYTPIILLGVVGVGGYLLYQALQNSGLGLTNTSNKQITDTATSAVNTDLANAAAASSPQILSNTEISGLSNTILSIANGTGSGGLSQTDQDTVVSQFTQIFSLTDLLLLIKDFGAPTLGTTANDLCGWTGISCQAVTLPTFINNWLDSAHVATINGYLSASNINYQF